MILADRYYVAIARRGLRRHLVMRTTSVETGPRRSFALRYDIIERRFTHQKAVKRARILNARNGRAH